MPTKSDTRQSLLSGFLASAQEHSERPALEVDGTVLTYRELLERALGLAATLERHAPAPAEPLTAVYGARSASAFSGVLGALLHGHGYVPLNPSFPAERNASMLRRAGCSALVVDAGCAPGLDDLLGELAEEPLLIVLPDEEQPGPLSASWPQHAFLGAGDIEPPAEPHAAAGGAIAYLLFTSGSTGIPKGVGVTHANAAPYCDLIADRYDIGPEDRCSQAFELTFDLSVHDMFVTWSRGACLCCPSARDLLQPGPFIRAAQLTTWFSVPSTGVFMRRLKALKPASYPELRRVSFCGEPLPLTVAEAFAGAAPNAIVENLYGPTEATIACTGYRFESERAALESEQGVVPIGEPLPGTELMVVDSELREVAPGEDGELLVAGPQVTPGYWHDPDRTAAAFVVPPERGERHYRTGDRVRRPRRASAPLTHLGRLDHQIKVLGHRVELGEVEAALRQATGVDACVAVGWPRTEAGVAGIIAFIGDLGVDVDDAQASLARRLPEYMVPRRLELLAELPLNSNGKFDRPALAETLEREREPNLR